MNNRLVFFKKLTAFTIFAIGIVASTEVYRNLFIVPQGFPQGDVRFRVGEGESLYSISKRLEKEHLIRSATLFRIWIAGIDRDKHIGLGVYRFTAPLTLSHTVKKFIQGPDEPLLSITIPEGSTSKDVALLIYKAIPTISTEHFGNVVVSNHLNGYLFPSTYYVLPSYKEEDIAPLMKQEFEVEYVKHFARLPYPALVPNRDSVIALASIIEGEAKTPDDMKHVSGILQNRLKRGMRLQVDVSKSTYTSSGLPKEPLNNPGLVAIDAVFHPLVTKDLYYLTGKDGTMHYAETFAGHERNIALYLK